MFLPFDAIYRVAINFSPHFKRIALVRNNRWKLFILIDCLADSGAAETYTADKRKMAVPPPPQQKAMSVLWYWETRSVIQMQRRYRREYGEQAPGRQSIKRWLEHFQETVSVLHKKGAGRPSVDADTRTVKMVREQHKLSRCAWVIWYIFNQMFSFNKMAPLHTGAYSESLWRKRFQTDESYGMNQSLGPLAPPI
jgi:hypothetical protein